MFAHATNSASPTAFDGLVSFVLRLRGALIGAFEAQRVYNDLASLSAAQLAARGLTREDIPRMTLQAMNAASDD